MNISFDFNNKTIVLNKSQIVLYTSKAKHPFFIQCIVPFALRELFDKPIIYVNENGDIDEIAIISAIGIEDRIYGFIFSIFSDIGIRSSNQDNHAVLYDDFAVVRPGIISSFTDMKDKRDTDCAYISNDSVEEILDQILSVVESENVINDIKNKYRWIANEDQTIIVGSFS